MPGIDGYQVLTALKGHPATASIPIIMITGMTDDVSRMRSLSAGALEVIAKPVGRADVVARVNNALRLRVGGSRADAALL